MTNDTVTLHVEGVEYETEGAILVEIEGEKFWVPKVCIDDDSEVYSKRSGEGGGDLVVSLWWAEKVGIS